MNRRNVVIAGILGGVVIVLAVIAFFVFGTGAKQEVSMEEPIDIVGDFYQNWLAAAHSTTTDPYKEGLAELPILSKDLRKSLKKADRSLEGVDPVLCQWPLPEAVGVKVVYEFEDKIEMVVTARRATSTEQSIVSLLAQDEGWYIDNIRCSLGEFAPEREFSFDREGYLLKSVPAPLNPEYWHVIFTENDTPGHYAPLFFSEESTCEELDGSVGTCDPDSFVEASKVYIQGQMSELGVEVKKLKKLES